MIDAFYLVTKEEELTELKSKIKKLEQVIGFSCPPINNPDNMNPRYIIVKKGRAGDFDSCNICPFPNFELSLIDLQKKGIKKPQIDVADSERIILTYQSDVYVINFRNNL
jgi:hypothetical protein